MSEDRVLKELPPLLIDEDTEKFTDEADLSEYDLSGSHGMDDLPIRNLCANAE